MKHKRRVNVSEEFIFNLVKQSARYRRAIITHKNETESPSEADRELYQVLESANDITEERREGECK
jgi:hypothetical protein